MVASRVCGSLSRRWSSFALRAKDSRLMGLARWRRGARSPRLPRSFRRSRSRASCAPAPLRRIPRARAQLSMARFSSGTPRRQTLAVDAGSTLTANRLSVGNGGTGNGTVTITGTTSGPADHHQSARPAEWLHHQQSLEGRELGTGNDDRLGGAIVNGLNPPGGVPTPIASRPSATSSSARPQDRREL